MFETAYIISSEFAVIANLLGVSLSVEVLVGVDEVHFWGISI